MEWKNISCAVLLATNAALLIVAAHWRGEAERAERWAAAVEYEAACLVEAVENGR